MQRRRRPRALTLTLPDEKQPYLVLSGKQYLLRNFSQDGIGLWVPAPAPFGLTPRSQLNGDIVIGSHIHPVQLEIAHGNSRFVGLKIVHQSPELAEIFKNLLEPTAQASELKPHPTSSEEDPDNGYRRLWYAAPAGTELLVWFGGTARTIIALQLCWGGKWVYRAQAKRAQTGFLAEGQLFPCGRMIPPPHLLVHHDTPSAELLKEAAQFLGSTPPPLPGYLFWQFLETGEQVFLPAELPGIARVA